MVANNTVKQPHRARYRPDRRVEDKIDQPELSQFPTTLVNRQVVSRAKSSRCYHHRWIVPNHRIH